MPESKTAGLEACLRLDESNETNQIVAKNQVREARSKGHVERK